MHSSRSTDIAAAFSEVTRIRLLCLLRDEERCVGDLVAATGIPQPSVSRHLAFLLRVRLVRARTEGLHHFYRLAPVDHPLQECLFACLGRCLADIGDTEPECACPSPAQPPQAVAGGREKMRINISA